MNRYLPTLCSFAVALWGYQTGLWFLAIPMIALVEGRWLITSQWSTPHPQRLYAFSGLILLLSFSFLQASEIGGAGFYTFIQCLPIGAFPLLLCQIYCPKLTVLLGQRFGRALD